MNWVLETKMITEKLHLTVLVFFSNNIFTLSNKINGPAFKIPQYNFSLSHF
jgi:hypothetical protein